MCSLTDTSQHRRHRPSFCPLFLSFSHHTTGCEDKEGPCPFETNTSVLLHLVHIPIPCKVLFSLFSPSLHLPLSFPLLYSYLPFALSPPPTPPPISFLLPKIQLLTISDFFHVRGWHHVDTHNKIVDTLFAAVSCRCCYYAAPMQCVSRNNKNFHIVLHLIASMSLIVSCPPPAIDALSFLFISQLRTPRAC